MFLLPYLALTGTSPPTVPALVPDGGDLPGFTTLQNLADGVAEWALIAAVVGVVIGAVMWAFGHYSQNYQQAYQGRRGVMVSALAALLIGGSSPIVNFLLARGVSLK